MKKLVGFLFALILTFHFSLITLTPVLADELEEIQKQIDDLQHQLDLSVKATTPLESEVKKLEEQLASIKIRLTSIQKDLAKSEEDLVYQKKILAQTVRNLYIRSFVDIPLLTFFASDDASETLKLIAFQASSSKEDRNIIRGISEKIAKLSDDKKRLASAQAQIDRQSQFLKGEIATAKAYQSEIQGKISALTAQQQEILAQKLGSLNLPATLGAGPLFCTDDRKIDPGFGQAFAFFTFGIPHRVGMNQYGAYGRAKVGQDYRTILNAYFAGISFENRPNININVDGYGSMQLETYLLGIYEMPDNWTDNDRAALKAQAVAARSYALAYTNNGANSICTSQQCQVYKGGNKGGNWEAAVKATEGEVMVNGGQVVKAWYASTAGGYTFNSGDVWGNATAWTKRMRDTSGDVGGFSDLMNKAYDRDSPCFYAAQGWRSQYGKSAWLKPEEVADIANVILLVRKDSSAACFVYQTDKPPPPPNPAKGCPQTGNWSADEVKQKLGGQALSTATSVEVTGVDWGEGRTTQIKINGIPFDGNEFKNYFNLRASANIQIVGPLFNIEQK